MPTDSILKSIKKLLGITEDYTQFDTDIMIHINSAFARLNQLGVGPDKTFAIEDDSKTWEDFLQGNDDLNSAKSYVYLKVKQIFDPPETSFTQDSIQRQIDQFEWTLNVAASTPAHQTTTS